MSWDFVPEVFFDLIARIMPGSILILTTVLIIVGPTQAVNWMFLAASTINASLLLLLLLASYLMAIVLKQVWEAGEHYVAMRHQDKLTDEQKDKLNDRLSLHRVAASMPAEAAKLLKIQAEKNFCEVLIAGLSVLVLINLSLLWPSPRDIFNERIRLLAPIILTILTCWRWRNNLERQFIFDLCEICKHIDSRSKELNR